MRVLFLDDDPYVLQVMARMLSRDVEVEIATTFGEAWQRLQASPIDAVVSDQKLGPGATGLQFLELLAVSHPHVVRLVMSGDEVPGWERHAKALLRKPFTRDAFLAALNLRRGSRSLEAVR